MLEIKVIVDAGNWEAQGVKEALGMLLERWGKSRVVEVREIPQDDIVQGLAEMALQEMIDGEGKEE